MYKLWAHNKSYSWSIPRAHDDIIVLKDVIMRSCPYPLTVVVSWAETREVLPSTCSGGRALNLKKGGLYKHRPLPSPFQHE